VKQGCLLYPTLFAVYINDLTNMLKYLNRGIAMGEDQIIILLFADGIAFISDTEIGMQQIINCPYQLCMKWYLLLTIDKTNNKGSLQGS
jgi:hypothetical protein